MKILMFGRGVIAAQYGWALEKAGHRVEFYVRPGRMAEYGDHLSLQLLDARKKITGESVRENWKITMREDWTADHDYDVIIVSVQHYHFPSAVDLLADKIGKATILLFNNFWEEPQEAVARLPADQLLWGFPRAGGGFDADGVLNGSLMGDLTMAAPAAEQAARSNAVREMFQSAGFKAHEVKDFRSYLFSHFAVNAALQLENLKLEHGLASVDTFKTADYWRNVALNGKELLPLLKARKVDLEASPELKMFSAPPLLLSLFLRLAIRFLPPVRRIFTAHSNRDELKSYCQDVLKTAKELKIALPRFEADEGYYQ